MTKHSNGQGKVFARCGMTGLGGGYNIQDLENRYPGYLSGLTQLRMYASGNAKERVGLISLELRREAERENTNIRDIIANIAFKHMKPG